MADPKRDSTNKRSSYSLGQDEDEKEKSQSFSENFNNPLDAKKNGEEKKESDEISSIDPEEAGSLMETYRTVTERPMNWTMLAGVACIGLGAAGALFVPLGGVFFITLGAYLIKGGMEVATSTRQVTGEKADVTPDNRKVIEGDVPERSNNQDKSAMRNFSIEEVQHYPQKAVLLDPILPNLEEPSKNFNSKEQLTALRPIEVIQEASRAQIPLQTKDFDLDPAMDLHDQARGVADALNKAMKILVDLDSPGQKSEAPSHQMAETSKETVNLDSSTQEFPKESTKILEAARNIANAAKTIIQGSESSLTDNGPKKEPTQENKKTLEATKSSVESPKDKTMEVSDKTISSPETKTKTFSKAVAATKKSLEDFSTARPLMPEKPRQSFPPGSFAPNSHTINNDSKGNSPSR